MCYGNKLTIHVSPEVSWLLIGLFFREIAMPVFCIRLIKFFCLFLNHLVICIFQGEVGGAFQIAQW